MNFLEFIDLNDNKKLYGVYKITCITNGRIYIGSTTRSFSERIRNHYRSLLSNNNGCSILQKCYNKYGYDSFIVSVIEVCHNKDIVIERENFYLSSILKSDTNRDFFNKSSMNVCPVAGSNLGRVLSDESKLKISLSNKGRVRTDEMKLNMRNAHIGIKLSERHRASISKYQKGSTRPSLRIPIIQYSIDGYPLVEYDFIRYAKKFGYNHSLIIECCNGKRKTHAGFRWSYAKDNLEHNILN